MFAWLKRLLDRGADPVYGCDQYRDKADGSCSHVVGPLCDFPDCSMLSDYRQHKACSQRTGQPARGASMKEWVMGKCVEVNARDLIGPALNWAVAYVVEPDGCWNAEWFAADYCTFRPSTDWAQGGPLIEDYKPDMSFEYVDDLDRPTGVWVTELETKGPTLLVAVCRAFVADKLGYVVAVPEELIAASGMEVAHG